MNLRTVHELIKGGRTFIPLARRIKSRGIGGSTGSARYCYSVWLRHLVMAGNSGLPTNLEAIAELGPGDSLGTGIAALISGVNRYYGLDVVRLANTERNLSVYEELIRLFERREDIPDDRELPEIKPYLISYRFPSEILTDEILKRALKKDRLASIRNAIISPEKSGPREILISYIVPWPDSMALEESSVDMIFSQAVLEYVENLKSAYEKLYKWLGPNGFMSHTIGFGCHNTAKEWDGHWTYSDLQWKIIKGRRPMSVTREPYSSHIRFIKEAGFKVICDIRMKNEPEVQARKLAPRFKNMSYDDRSTAGTFIQAAKPQFRMPVEV